MVFAQAAGYTNLNNGVFSPTIWSKKIHRTHRKQSVVEDITNTEFFGEIKNQGDTVRIIKEPNIAVNKLERGTTILAQDLVDEDFTLGIDQGNYWSFTTDDIEKMQAHLDWENMATDKAGYELADAKDAECLGYMTGYKTPGAWEARIAGDKNGTDPMTVDADGLLAGNKFDYGTFGETTNPTYSIPLAPDGSATTPLQLIARMKRRMDELNVPKQDRFLVVDPVFLELLGDENSKLLNHDYTSASEDILRNGLVTKGMVRGFYLYESNNLPYLGSGAGISASGGSATDFGVVLAGTKTAVATATAMTITEKLRNQTKIGDIVRGAQVYGRKILRPENLVRANYNMA